MKTVDNRLLFKQIMEIFALNQSDMAKRIGIHQTNVSAIVRGERSCGDAIMAKVAKAFPEINKDWLLTGEGNMLVDAHEIILNNKYMENTVRQRLLEFINYKNLKVSQFERQCGISNGYVNKLKTKPGYDIIDAIIATFPDLNIDYILKGKGEMLKPTASIQQHNVNGNNNYVGGSQYNQRPECGGIPVLEAEEVRRPIIPTEWTYQPNVDLYEKVQTDRHAVSRSRFIALDVPIDMWHIVRDDSLLPDCKRGDALALNAYPIGQENPVPGKLHAVDTRSNGIIIRKLFFEDYGYRGIAPNPEYPELKIMREDVIRVYRIVCLARIAL